MARKWTEEEMQAYRAELHWLYVVENRSIGEISDLLGIAESTVFQRLQRLGIPSTPVTKDRYLNKRKDIKVPTEYSPQLAEFFGIMLGDGHISPTQVVVTLGTKEIEYVQYVACLMTNLFSAPSTINVRKDGYRDIYIGSVALTTWLKGEGLVHNKVAAQVDVPAWILEKNEYMRSFVRGFFDTDGSVYRLRFGIQISFTNRSLPILHSLHHLLTELGYTTSAVCQDSLYVTRRNDVNRFFREIAPANQKHVRRYKLFSEELTRR